MSQKETFSDRIKYLRNQEDWPQSYLAKKLGISVGSYSSYERGLGEPSLSILLKLSKIFCVSIDYLAKGEEFVMPLTLEQTNRQQIERMTLRIENRIDRQTRLLNHVSSRLEDDISTIIKSYSDDFSDILSRSSATILLEEELWKLESCADQTFVAYSDISEFLNYDQNVKGYIEGDHFQNLVSILRECPDNKYTEIYAENVNSDCIGHYRKLIKKYCGNAALKRIEMRQTSLPIVTQCLLYSLRISKLRKKHPSIYQLIENSIVDEKFVGVLVTPNVTNFGVNFIADPAHTGYLNNYFEYLLSQSKLF